MGNRRSSAQASVEQRASAGHLALGRSRLLNLESLDKVQAMVATSHHEGATKVWPVSQWPQELPPTAFPIFTHFLLCGLVPPVSDFFYALLENYQIHMLHLCPEEVLLLTNFAYLCEALCG